MISFVKWISYFRRLKHAFNERSEVKKQKVGDIEIAYYTRGSGEPLVLVMGFRATMGMWDPGLLDELAKRYQLILLDNRGVGFSTDTAEDQTTISQMAQDTFGLIQALGHKKVHLLGWSMGSLIGIQLALDHPEILQSLILCSPSPGGKHHVDPQTDAYAILTAPELSTEDAFSLIYPKNAKGALAAAGFVARMTKALAIGKIPNNLNVPQPTIERQARALHQWGADDTIDEKLTRIKVPTLVLGGTVDLLDLPENVRRVAHQIPYAWSAYFPESGHGFVSQNYLDLTKLIHAFVHVAAKT